MIEVVASIFVLLGVWFYGQKMVLGPTAASTGCILWIAIALDNGMWELAILNLILLIVNLHNLLKWSRSKPVN